MLALTNSISRERDTLRKVGRFVLAFWRRSSASRLLAAVALLLAASVIDGVSVLFLIPILGLATPGADSFALRIPAEFPGMPLQGMSFGPGVALAIFFALIVLQAVFQRFRSVFMGQLLFDFVAGTRLGLFQALSDARWEVFAGYRGSDIEHALTHETDRVQGAAFYVLMIMQVLILLVIYGAASLLVSPGMTAFACGAGAVLFLALQPFRSKAASHGRNISENRRKMQATLTELIAGMKVAKTLNVEAEFVRRLNSIQSEMRAFDRTFVLASTNSSAVFNIFAGFALCVFVYAALTQFALTLPKIIVLLLLFMRIFQRFKDMQTYLEQLLQCLPAAETVAAIQDRLGQRSESAMRDRIGWLDKRAVVSLELVRVSYAYEAGGHAAALTDVSIVLPAGQVTALIGHSGSGKSTIAEILLGLRTQRSGHMLIDGRPLGSSEIRAWRNHVAHVSQDVFLFNDTIANNLRVSAPDATDEDLWTALGLAEASGFVARLPNGLATIVGDRGAKLSGGERQRIALARALVRKPALLILDEATSALDWQNQMQISGTIERLRGKTTILTIAHRPSMIAFADHVIALEDGRVAETGGFEALTGRPESRLSKMLAAESAAV